MSDVTVVIGAGQIGQAIARRVSSGKHVLLADLRQASADAAAEVLADAGFDVSTAPVDVSSRESVHALAATAAALGDVTGVIHAAGVSPSQARPEVILAVDLYGTALVLEEFGNIIASGGSAIVIASQSGHRLDALTAEQDAAPSARCSWAQKELSSPEVTSLWMAVSPPPGSTGSWLPADRPWIPPGAPRLPAITSGGRMKISRNAATAKGPAETFTGDVWVDPITRGLPPSALNVAAVRFTPGARSAWHSHDGGQTLYVTEGRGLVQVRGQDITELNPGDVVFAPQGEEHWHGARPDHFMTHLSITEGAPHWGPHVTDAEYRGQPEPGRS